MVTISKRLLQVICLVDKIQVFKPNLIRLYDKLVDIDVELLLFLQIVAEMEFS